MSPAGSSPGLQSAGEKDGRLTPANSGLGVRTQTAEGGAPRPAGGWSKWFGGPGVVVGPRIGPVLPSLRLSPGAGSTSVSDGDIVKDQLALEDGCAIQYRTCSWEKTAALLFSEYICLAIMSFPWSYSVLGLVPGLIFTVLNAAIVLYTSLILWEFCLRHPEVRDMCDIGQMLFWGKEWAWYATAFMFLLNNTFIQALHVLVGAKYLNTMTASDRVACRTVSFSVIVALVCWLCSLPRTFSSLSRIATASAVFTFVSVLLAAVFAGVQAHPPGWTPASGEPEWTLFPVEGTTFVAALNAFLNISYTCIGQITLPSFVAEMEEPRDFPKALWACTVLEVIVFSIVGAVVYVYVGNAHMTAPAFGSLQPLYKKVAFSFMIPTLIFLGVLYASLSARFIFFRLFKNDTRHKNEHTVKGWATWTGILFATWVLAFFIAEVIPFFSSLLSLMSSLFDSFFGFIFWGVAYFCMRRVDGRLALVSRHTVTGYAGAIVNILIIAIGFFFLTAGTYASVQEIVDEFRSGLVAKVFTCASNGL